MTNLGSETPQVRTLGEKIDDFLHHYGGNGGDACYLLAEARIELSAALAKVREVERERDALKRLGGIKCPCENEQPDPCPLCGATVADGICGAGNPLALLNHERAESAESRMAELEEIAAAERRRGDKKEDEIIGLLARIAELEAVTLEYRKQELCELMSDISEECYCAGWLIGNEHRLWRAITDPNDDRRYGMGLIEEWQVNRLRELSEAVNGWWVWEDDDAAFISLDEWRRRLAVIDAARQKEGA